ncbi:MAG: DUF3373 domain-containing protein [Sulfurovum sp.]|nr:DUF3373 domain-containing protein [Sulfurovum sp.]
MKKIIGLSLIAATTIAFASTANDIASLKKEIVKLKKKVSKVNAQTANDNIKWGADFRTSIDSINYKMANGQERSKNDLMSSRLWLNMAYTPDNHSIFKGQLSTNKAFGANFYNSSPTNQFGFNGGMSSFDWIGNEALGDTAVRVRQAYWLYLGDKAFGLNMPWTFSVGRRPSTNGFLANLRDDDMAQSPLGHNINVEFDGLSSKLDLSNVTGIPGMSIKLCMGQGSTNITPMFNNTGTWNNNDNQGLKDIKLGGFIFEPYNDGQIVTKATWFRAYDLPEANIGYISPFQLETNIAKPYGATSMTQVGDMTGAAFSVMVDGLTEDGYFSDTKVFASVACSKTLPNGASATQQGVSTNTYNQVPGMLGSTESKTGTSWWIGTQLPVMERGKFGFEYNHGSQYWRPFTYGEDTMIGSKLAARGNAWETYFTYQITDALSAQMRYTKIDYDYTGSNGFFGSNTGNAMKISDLKAYAARFKQALRAGSLRPGTAQYDQAMGLIGLEQTTVSSASDFRFYIRYRF